MVDSICCAFDYDWSSMRWIIIIVPTYKLLFRNSAVFEFPINHFQPKKFTKSDWKYKISGYYFQSVHPKLLPLIHKYSVIICYYIFRNFIAILADRNLIIIDVLGTERILGNSGLSWGPIRLNWKEMSTACFRMRKGFSNLVQHDDERYPYFIFNFR